MKHSPYVVVLVIYVAPLLVKGEKPSQPILSTNSTDPTDADAVLLTCTTTTSGITSYGFFKDGSLVQDELKDTLTLSPGNNPFDADNGNYQCKARKGSKTSTFSNTLTVTIRPQAPVLTANSTATEVGDTVELVALSITAGTPKVFTFRHKGPDPLPYVAQSGESDTYVIPSFQFADTGAYAATVTINGQESDYSNIWFLYEAEPITTTTPEPTTTTTPEPTTTTTPEPTKITFPEPTTTTAPPPPPPTTTTTPTTTINNPKPEITIETDGDLTDMDTVVLVCTIEEDFAPSNCEFYKDGVKVTTGVEHHTDNGATIASLTILHAVLGVHDGSYTCVAITDEDVASDTSDPFIVILRPQAPVLAANSTVTEAGEAIQFVAISITAGFPKVFTFRQVFEGELLTVVQSGESDTYVIPSFQDSDIGAYTATVTINGQESDSSNAVLLLLEADSAVVSDTASCLPDWSFFNNQCYKFFDEQKIWIKAHDFCVAEGGTLALSRTPEEAGFLEDLVHKSGKNPAIWLNAKDYKDGQWVWQDTQTEVDWFNWCEGETPTKGPRRDCVIMYEEETFPPQYCWSDVGCDGRYDYVCVKDAEPNVPDVGQLVHYLESRIEKLDEKLQVQSHVESGLRYCGYSFGLGYTPEWGPCIWACSTDPDSCPEHQKCVFNGCGQSCQAIYIEIDVKFSRAYPRPPAVVASVAWGQWEEGVDGSFYVWAHNVTEEGFTLRCGVYDRDTYVMNLAATWVASPRP